MIQLAYNQLAAEAHFISVKDALQNRIRNILVRGIQIGGQPYRLRGRYRLYLHSLQTNDDELRNLITAKPETFETLIDGFKTNLPNFLEVGHKCYHTIYNVFISSCYNQPEKFCKLDFIKRIAIDTCPYCNRNYIYYLSKAHEIKPQIDHFFPKSLYPFLGMSFYNLIPSCQTCNGFGAKEEKDPLAEGLRNPYLIRTSDFSFGYQIKSSSILDALIDKSSIKLQMSRNIAGNMRVFKLKELYQQHTDHVIELIIKSKVKYPETYRRYLKTYIEKGVQISDNDIDRMILGNYASEAEIHKRPLAKLYQNIGQQLGLIPQIIKI